MNISNNSTNRVGYAKCSIGRVANPAVRAVTDWKKAFMTASPAGMASRAPLRSANQIARVPPTISIAVAVTTSREWKRSPR